MSEPKPYMLRVERLGDGLGLTFPQKVMDRYGFEAGAHVCAVEPPDGISLKKAAADFHEAMEVFEEISARYANALCELAKP